jgi:hypothetical protein
VRKAGYVLVVLAWILLFTQMMIGSENRYVGLGAVLSMLAGILFLGVSFVHRIAIGQIGLRPLAALKRAPILFVVMAGMLVTMRYFFPSTDRSDAEILMIALIFSVSFGIYTTVYRRIA